MYIRKENSDADKVYVNFLRSSIQEKLYNDVIESMKYNPDIYDTFDFFGIKVHHPMTDLDYYKINKKLYEYASVIPQPKYR